MTAIEVTGKPGKFWMRKRMVLSILSLPDIETETLEMPDQPIATHARFPGAQYP